MRCYDREGFTLPELVVVVVLAGVLLGAAVPRAAATLDRIAAAAARDLTAGAIARTRAVAVARGGAALVVRRAAAVFWIEDAQGARMEEVDLARAYGITLDASGTGEEIRVRYDALGIGRLASRTLRFRRGDAVATLVISSYGRVTRR